MMRRIWGSLVAGILCAGCAGLGSPEPQKVFAAVQRSAPEEGTALVYACPDGFRFTARIEQGVGGNAWLLLPDRTLELQPQEAASGVRYARDGVIFWTKGDEALLELDGVGHEGCQAVHDGDGGSDRQGSRGEGWQTVRPWKLEGRKSSLRKC